MLPSEVAGCRARRRRVKITQIAALVGLERPGVRPTDALGTCISLPSVPPAQVNVAREDCSNPCDRSSLSQLESHSDDLARVQSELEGEQQKLINAQVGWQSLSLVG